MKKKKEYHNQSSNRHYSSSIIFVIIGIGSIILNQTSFLLFSLSMITIGLTGIIVEYFFNSNEPRDERMKLIGYKSGFFSHHITNISIIVLSFLVAFNYVSDITMVLLSLLLINSLSFIVSLTINSMKS